MGRPKGDQKYRNEVIIIEENKKWKCKHCEGTYSGGFSRIKAHLDKTQGKGISKCRVYRNKEGASSSIDPQEPINTLNPSQADQGACGMINTIGDSINRQTNRESSSLLGDLGVSGGSNGYSDLSTSQRSQLNDLVSDLKRDEDDIMAQLHWLESRGKKRKTEVDDWLDKLKKPKERAIKMNNLLHQFGSSVVHVLETLGDEKPYELEKELRDLLEQKPLVLSNEFVGWRFEDNVKEMWELLGDDKVMTIGIHGMGGVGKTCLASYVHNEIKRKATFNHVFWVTVSCDFTIFKLQDHIAEAIGFKLDAKYEDTRATILASELEKLEKTVLILDDVWNYIDLQKVGIPLKPNGIKLIITTRLKHVCRQMDCLPRNNMIEIEPLWGEAEEEEEDWELFLLKVGQHGTPATLPPQVLEIARSVVKKCDGLPLGISVMARTMKGQDDIVWWRRALETFEMGQEMKEEVFTILKRSYDHLIEQDLRNCFLHCALLPILWGREDLIRQLTESGVLNGKRSLREIFDEAHIIVDKLIDHSLLLLDWGYFVKMHGLVRIMACHILNNVMVKCNEGLIKIPDLREWRVDLEAVSLAGNWIKEIRKGTSPNCPRLSTLILSDNEISDIPECFFTQMNALTLLDLSYNDTLTSLPNSLSQLTSLTCLDLRGCSRLKSIPPLGALQALSRLDISGCSISQVPQGLQNLINLKWLDLSWTKNSPFITVPGSVLSGLTNMQYLDLHDCTVIKVEDLRGMTMLECFGGSFLNWDDYNCYVQDILDSGYGSETYLIRYGELEKYPDYGRPIYLEFKRRTVEFGDCEELSYLLPKELEKLRVVDNNQWVRLCSSLFSTGFSLENIHIKNCKKLKSLFCLSSSCSLCPNIQNLESLRLDNLKSLTAICKEDDVDLPQSLSRSGVFSHLKSLYIYECHEIEMLMTPALVPQLQNLERLRVWSCDSMKEIFAVSSSGDDDSFNITLPKLGTLELKYLPELKTVCKGILVCESEDILTKIGCPKLVLPEIRRHH